MLINSRKITISAAGSRKAALWQKQTVHWSDFVNKLRTPIVSTETISEYLALPKSKQDELKDVGGFVAGELKNGRRKATHVISRELVTLDMDNLQPGSTKEVLRRVEALGCGYAVYSTRKHEESRPRLRIIVPLDRSSTADEYEPIARKLAEILGIEQCDPTTFEASRLMYWPSCSADSQYVFQSADKPFLLADGMLSMYTDWRNYAEWPQVPGQDKERQRTLVKQQDPTEKSGIVGAFCKSYDIYGVMQKFLLGEYEPVDGIDDRFTYVGGSTVGGAVVYDHGKFIYSHHATDPGSGKLLNAFDFLRLHRFAELDDDAKPDTPANKLPSFIAACELAIADSLVATVLSKERYDKAIEAFGETRPEKDIDWVQQLEISPRSGMPARTIRNARVVLENDPVLRGRIRFDTFSEYIIGIAPMPWSGRELESGPFRWQDEDDAGLRDYIERILKFRVKDIVADAIILCAKKYSFNPVTAYFEGLNWDGVKRLERMYIDYLGAENCEYTKVVTRKGFVAAVARVKMPGVKFDTMTVIKGTQGLGKTTLLQKMGMDWFSNSIKTFEGKDAAELLQGTMIVEVGEMEAYKKSDIRAIKGFLSKCDDHYRAAYARKTEKHPRKCVFFGTTNDDEYLSDPTGNRRIWPVEAGVQKNTKSVFRDLTRDEIDQIWAEAYVYWQLGESLVLSDEMEAEAEKRRQVHMERDPMQGQIEEFLDSEIPEDWSKWNPTQRQMYWGGTMKAEKTILRDRVCAAEIWRECLRDHRTNIPKLEAHRINSILEQLKDWERSGIMRFGCGYGRQKGFKRVHQVNQE